MNRKDLDMYDKLNRENGTEAITRAAKVLRDAALEIERWGNQLTEKHGDEYALHSAAAALRMHWVINHCASNLLGNLRLDSMALYAGQMDALYVLKQEELKPEESK